MKKIVFFLGITVMLLFLCGTARAAPLTKAFGDNSIHWPGYPSNQYTHDGQFEDDLDVVGIPDILGGTVEYTIPYTLEAITLSYTHSSTYWEMLVPGDLFLDVDADGDWDYIAQSQGTQAAGTWNVYAAPSDLQYISTPASGHVYYTGYGTFDVRNGHPYAASNLSDLVGAVSFGGWADPGASSLTTSWDFASLNIALQKTLAIGYTVSCANDVIYEVITLPQGGGPVPVPGAIWLLGSGLLALVGLRRKFST